MRVFFFKGLGSFSTERYDTIKTDTIVVDLRIFSQNALKYSNRFSLTSSIGLHISLQFS